MVSDEILKTKIDFLKEERQKQKEEAAKSENGAPSEVEIREWAKPEMERDLVVLLVETEQCRKVIQNKRSSILQTAVLCFFSQVVLCIFVLIQIAILDQEQIFAYESRVIVIFSRFICAIILHAALMDECRMGLDLMKYALNHAYYFENPGVAYAAGFMKVTQVFVVEDICLFVICISVAPMAIVYNFIALGIIAEFDNYIFDSFVDCLGELIESEPGEEPFFVVRHTTSS
jgi:hypothetical protein